MPVSQNQRLRKAAAKAAKRKSVVTDKVAHTRRELSISKPRHIDFAAAPIVACKLTRGFEKHGIATLLVARKLSLGRYGLCLFLLDTWCLGVKDSFFRVLDAERYEDHCEGVEDNIGTEPIDPARARKLLRDTAAYGASNGFPPSAAFPEVEAIFGDIAPSAASFTFGSEGKPHYVAGPKDSPKRSREILRVLERRFGPKGFHYTSSLDISGDMAGWLDDEGEILEGEAQEVATASLEPQRGDDAARELRAA